MARDPMPQGAISVRTFLTGERRRFGETSVSCYGFPAASRPTRARPGA